MNETLIAMLLGFVATLPAAPVRIYVSPSWQHILSKMWWTFVCTNGVLYAFGNKGIVAAPFDYFAIALVAPLAGFLVSIGVTSLFFGSYPRLRNPPTEERFVDPLYEWSREAIKYKVKRVYLPNLSGIAISLVLYLLLTRI
jgi:hypothetical protein